MDENTAVQQAQELETVETAQETQGETLQDTSAAPETTEQNRRSAGVDASP